MVACRLAHRSGQNVSFSHANVVSSLNLETARPIRDDENAWEWVSKDVEGYKNGDYYKDYSNFKRQGYKQAKELDPTPALSFLKNLYSDSQTKPNFKLACPFRKHDPLQFNFHDYDACSTTPWRSMRHLEMHIYRQHAVQIFCTRCEPKFDPSYDIRNPIVVCEPLPLQFDLNQVEERNFWSLWRWHVSRTEEERWQFMYRLLFPTDGRTVSPYFDPIIADPTLLPDSSEADRKLDDESAAYVLCGDCGTTVWMATAIINGSNSSAYSDNICSGIGHDIPLSFPDSYDSDDDIDIDNLVADGSYHSKSWDQYIDDYYEGTSSVNSNISSAQTVGHESGKATTQGDFGVSIGANHPTTIFATSPPNGPRPYLTCTGLVGNSPISPALYHCSGDDSFISELSPSDLGRSPSSSIDRSKDLYNESESESDENDDIDAKSKTYPAFDLVKRALFSDSTRQFWNFYNRLSASDWAALWLEHTINVGAASSSGEARKSTYKNSDTQTPPKSSSNTTPLSQKRQMKGDEDEDDTNNGKRPLKRRNRIPQKAGLEFACPFHKYKPWSYNHRFLPFRTCSISAFPTIYRLREHLSRVHPAPIYCDRCCQHFRDQNSLVNHRRADVPCPIRPIVDVEGWTTEMGARVKKRVTETERSCWDRIYRELFGQTLTDIPSPYFVPYSPGATNEAELESLLLQEVPQRVLNSLEEDINSIDIPDAARALFDASAAHLQIENRIRNAIRELCAEYRSSTVPENNNNAPPTQQSSSEHQFIARGSDAAQSNSPSTSQGSLQNAQKSSDDGSSVSATPSDSTETIQHSNNIVQLSALVEHSYSGGILQQSPALPCDLVPQTSRTVSEFLPLYHPYQFQSTQQYIQQADYDVTDAYGTSFDENILSDFDFQIDFTDDTFPNKGLGF